jgi:signal transduction histidine kinase
VGDDRPIVEPLAPLELAPAAIAIQRGPELRWELANREYRRLLGGVALVGQTLAEVLPDWSQLRRIVEQVAATGETFVARGQRFLIDPEGNHDLRDAWFDVLCQPLRDEAGQVIGVFSFAVDVSTQVETHGRLEKAVAEARRAIEARDDFLSVASHELKTPLTALRLQVQSLLRSLRRPTDEQPPREQLEKRLEAIDRQVDRLVELIEALLDVSRLSNEHFVANVEELDLAVLAQVIADRQHPGATPVSSPLTVEAPEPVRGHWDRSRVDQIITNLVSNAVKYGGGKPIVLSVVAGNDGAQVTVADQGIGIAASDHGRIFERFERAVPRTHYSGLGLGLWISRRIAEALGGRLTVESELGHGARFTLWLPA